MTSLDRHTLADLENALTDAKTALEDDDRTDAAWHIGRVREISQRFHDALKSEAA